MIDKMNPLYFRGVRPIPVIPTVYTDALSYGEQLGIIGHKTDECVDKVNKIIEDNQTFKEEVTEQEEQYKTDMQEQYDKFLEDYQRQFGVVQEKGTSTTNVMSQKFVTDELDKVVYKPNNSFGEAGQVLESTGTGIKWSDIGAPTQTQVDKAVNDWLDDHPEATTTVQNKSLTMIKFSDELERQTENNYVTPQMFGAVADGIVDDTEAIQDAINYAFENHVINVYFPSGDYLITSPIVVPYTTDDWWHERGLTLYGNKGYSRIRKDSNVTYNNIDTTIYIESQNTSTHTGTGVWIDSLDIVNGTEGTKYGITGDDFARSRFTHLTINAEYGLKATGFSNYYDDIIFFTPETALWIAGGTSDEIGKVGAFHSNNPYKIGSIYSNVDLLFGDNCTGDFVTLDIWGGTNINTIGAESPLCDCIVRVKAPIYAETRSSIIQNVCVNNLSGENTHYIIVENGRCTVNNMVVMYQNTVSTMNYVCQITGTYGELKLGNVKFVSNTTSFDKNKIALKDTSSGTLSVNDITVNYIDTNDGLKWLGNSKKFSRSNDIFTLENNPSIVLNGYIAGNGMGNFKNETGGDASWGLRPDVGSAYLTPYRKNKWATGCYYDATKDSVTGSDIRSGSAVFSVCGTGGTQSPLNVSFPVDVKNGLFYFDETANKLYVYMGGWKEVTLTSVS